MSLFPESVALALSRAVCSVDIDAFRAKYRAPLFPGQWNVWTLVRSLEDDPSIEQLQEELTELFGCTVVARNLVRTDPWFYDRGRIQGLTWGFFFPKPGQVNPPAIVDWGKLDKSLDAVAEKFQGRKDYEVAASISDIPELKSPKTYTVVTVAFIYRGHENSMPWPVNRRIRSEMLATLPDWFKWGSGALLPFTEGMTTFDIYCPANARWLLSDVMAPAPGAGAPGAGERVGDACKDDRPGFDWEEVIGAAVGGLENLGKVVSGLKTVGLVALAALGAAIVVPRVLK